MEFFLRIFSKNFLRKKGRTKSPLMPFKIKYLIVEKFYLFKNLMEITFFR